MEALSIKQVNDVTRLQALVDKKRVVVTEAAIREVLRLDDAEGVDCLPNEEIFIVLARMGYEKPSTKLTFYKAFLSSQCDLLTHTTKYASPTLTHKHKRLGKKEMQMSILKKLLLAMLLREMIVLLMEKFLLLLKNHPYHLLHHLLHNNNHLKIFLQHLRYNKHHHNHLRRLEHLEYDKVAQALEITKLKRRVKKLEKRNKGRMITEIDKDDAVVLMDDKEEDKKVEEAKVDESAQVHGRQAESQAEIYKIDMDHANKVLSMHEDETEPAEVQEVVDVVTTAKLITKVVTATSETVTAASIIIPTAESQVPAAILTAAPVRVAAAPSRRRKGVVIRDPKEESTTSTIIPAETKSKDKGKGILVEEPKPLKKKQQIVMDEEYARKLHDELNKDIDWDVAIDHVKLKAKEDPPVKIYQAIKRKPHIEAQARKNMMVYLKNVTKEQMEEEENTTLQTINETPTEKAAKKRKLNEEVEDLKRHLQIVPNKDDDVYTEATPLARKVPVVDYEIIEINNKPYYKIIRVDGTHELYISFLTLLRNFDREDLEALWNLVKESKGQELEATGIMWCAYHNLYNHAADFVSGKEVHKTTTSRRPASMMVEYLLHQAQEQDLDQAS
nr:hypothetical protein [Tanacetum cinerariifolium]GEZ36894.1 hypothetical protein [Tanacetum cinerariifolium]